ncbi:uncharacterized protein IAS62_005688 [Cryptococcus decagattii]|uniref:Uncharacterized protein n=1 Tax=Cryptococcus decagattii TaxID=1859122 RepID=A0ABZ2B0W4_9TREE
MLFQISLAWHSSAVTKLGENRKKFNVREKQNQQGCPRQPLLAEESSILEVIGLALLLQSRLSDDKHFSVSFLVLL